MSDKIVGYAITAGLVAVAASNLWVSYQVNDLKTEVQTIKGEVKEIKKDVAEVQKVVLYKSTEKLAVSDNDMECLAKNIFHEAGVEGRDGKIAVAQVTLNRVKSGRWGKSICDVVYSKAQFSWTLQKKKRNAAPKGRLWRESIVAAHEVIYGGERIRGLEDSGFYHTDYIKQPDWAKTKKVVISVGQHIFYQGVSA